MSKYFQEVAKKFSGDTELASKYMGVARQLLGGLKEMSGDLFHNARSVLLPDGTKISVSFAGAIAQVAIDVRDTASDTVSRYCDRFISGVVAVSETVTVTTDDGEVRKLRWFYPSEYEQSVEAIAADRIESEKLQDRYGTLTNCFAGSYSGDMRKAIQLLLGMNVDLVADMGVLGKKYKYTFAFDGTHGLVRDYDYSDDRPSYWLIQMPTNGYGVLAKRFAVCTDVTDKQRDNGVYWVPVGTTFGDDIAGQIISGDVVEILSMAEFENAVDGFTYTYPDCGWAFSSSGHECQNVLLGETGGVAATKRVIVSFGVSEDGIAASISQMDVCTFVGPLSSLPRVPVSTEYYASLLPIFEASTTSNPSYSGESDCAVHVFYDGDVAQVVRYKYAPGSVTSVRVGSYWNGSYALSAALIEPVEGVYEGSLFASGTTRVSYFVNGASINTNEFTGGGTEYGFTVGLGSFPGCPHAFETGLNGYEAFSVVGDLSVSNSYSRTFSQITNFVTMLVPFWQREGFIVLDASRKQYDLHEMYPGPYYRSSLKSGDVTLVGLRVTPECPSGVYFDKGNYHYTDYTINVENFVGDSTPPVTAYGRLYGGNGQASTRVGCYAEITSGCGGSITRQTPAASYIVPAKDEWEGFLVFIGPACRVSAYLGKSSAPDPNNAVKEKILNVHSTSYLDRNESQLAYAWTDAFDPKKYIVYNNINTVLGSDVISNTAYDFYNMDSMIKSFVGIAN